MGDSEAHTKLNIVIALKGTATWTAGGASANTASAFVTCGAAFAGDALVLTAIAGGTVGNLIATTEGLTHVSNVFDAVVLGTTRAGVDPTAGEFTTALVAAINDPTRVENVTAIRVSANVVLVYHDIIGPDATGTTETLSGVNNVWDAATLHDGALASSLSLAAIARVPNAVEVATDYLLVPLDFVPTAVVIDVRTTATGANVAWNGGCTILAGGLQIDNLSTVDWSAAETLYILAWA
jgi:hypothetical protein